MGNPAEKTIRNPNLKRLLLKVWKPVNKKFCFTAKFFFRLAQLLKFGLQKFLTLTLFNGNLDPSPDSA
jgi:hypothetical protein